MKWDATSLLDGIANAPKGPVAQLADIPQGRDLHTAPEKQNILQLSPEAIKAELNRQAYRLTPATFARQISFHQWIPAKHLKYISAIVASEFARGGARICISIPPRHGKSELFSIYMPIWILDRDPGRRIMQCAYAAELATEFSHRVRDIIAEDEIEEYNQIHARLKKDSKRADRFRTTVGVGGIVAAGVGGAITGRGANDLIIDDYMKNAKDSQSEVLRQDQWDWFKSTAMTRLEPNGNVIVIATRWNNDDIIGRLKEEESDLWNFITLRAIAEDNDPLGRAIGESLWPERYTLEDLDKIKRSLGTYWWQALYQQDPLQSMSGLFKDSWLPILEKVPAKEDLRCTRYWDLAGSEGEGDYTVGTLMGYNAVSDLTYIMDVVRGKWSPGTVEKQVVSTATRDGTAVKIVLEQEPGSSGKTVVDHYVDEVLAGYRANGDRVTGPKPVRAQPFLAAAEANKVRMLAGEWNKALLDEFKGFPDGLHDDIVDATSGAYNDLITKVQSAGAWGRNRKSRILSTARPQLNTRAVWAR